MERSVVRVSNIVDNVLDFARGISGTLASDIALGRLDVTLEGIVAEYEQLHAARTIERLFAIRDPVRLDHSRIAQMFANLLSNALTHGSPEGYVRAGGKREEGMIRIWVANQGSPIPEESMARLFKPFKRQQQTGKGLGLRLYIASEIARAHGGTLDVRSDENETRFTVVLPDRCD